VGATSILAEGGCRVAHLTDGAPADPALWPAGFHGSRQEYAQLRRCEARAALALAGVRSAHVHALAGSDQRAIQQAALLIAQLHGLLEELRPPVLVSHAYEGGHPDHDAAAFIAWAALRARPEIDLVEMTSYHAAPAGWVAGEFLPSSAPVWSVELSPPAQGLKRRMFEAHRSQRAVLGGLFLTCERFRPAPRYDFSQPPHAGRLLYEQRGWMTGAEWRRAARGALDQLDRQRWLSPS
jgi:LmbE family N-acetylglucosaminyl deacetylase